MLSEKIKTYSVNFYTEKQPHCFIRFISDGLVEEVVETTVSAVQEDTTVFAIESQETVTVPQVDTEVKTYHVPELPDEKFAIFGTKNRPVFPPDTTNFIPENSSFLSPSHGSPPHSDPSHTTTNIDVHLAQLAEIRVDSSNDSVVNVFVANDGLNCCKLHQTTLCFATFLWAKFDKVHLCVKFEKY